MTVLVAYLVAPGEEYGDKASHFVESYYQHPAGMPHDMLIIQKVGSYLLPYGGEWCQQCDRLFFEEHPNEGYDIGSLQYVCANHYRNYSEVCWLGSCSRILADNWLKKLVTVLRRPNPRVGAVSATGSFEKGISQQWPNSHLRTNGLVISPQVLLDLQFNQSYTRQDCYEFEHGIHSLTRRLERSQYEVLVVGADGNGYSPSLWADSMTFRRGEQENLLIADRQTDAYLAAGPQEREALAKAAGFPWP